MKICTLFMAFMALIHIAHGGEIETAKVKLSPKVKLVFQAERTETKDSQPAPGICIFRDQLWEFALTNPPLNILVKGELNLEGQKIALNVSGLAAPWVTPDELRKGECRLRKMEQ